MQKKTEFYIERLSPLEQLPVFESKGADKEKKMKIYKSKNVILFKKCFYVFGKKYIICF